MLVASLVSYNPDVSDLATVILLEEFPQVLLISLIVQAAHQDRAVFTKTLLLLQT